MKNHDNISKCLFLGSLIMNHSPDLKLKMAASKMTNRDNIGENVFSEVFGFADYKSVIRFSKF